MLRVVVAGKEEEYEEIAAIGLKATYSADELNELVSARLFDRSNCDQILLIRFHDYLWLK